MSHKGDVFRCGVLEMVGSKAGRAEDDPDSGIAQNERVTSKTHQLTSYH